ncbi:MAG: hypothetical protein ACKVY0_22530 [Prosthecobacter sp.]|uniref:TIGR03943 family putative permease subunit n=1 Tax=Prosthecobacter sp. TaxID=1965333 RepID=UPI00390004B9
MSGTRTLVHLLSVAMLLLWGGVLIYFYASGRLVNYLPPDGIFRPMVLVSGIGLAVLGLFNLLTMGAEDPGCEGHDHGHDDHDHDHKGCGHDHSPKHGACGHDHGHEHKHEHGTCDHDHAHHEGCGHDHSHDEDEDCGHDHAKKAGGCGHDHGHTHDHGHAHSHEGHAHGILEESSWPGRITVLLILAAPLSWAALSTPDRYSPNAVVNKGLYDPNYADTSRAEQFSLQNKPKTAAKPETTSPIATTSVTVEKPATPPPPGVAAVSAANAETQTPPKNVPPPAQASKSYGTFTLEDLKAQVPQSKDGNFILEVPELYYTGGDVEVQKVITGQMVETIAQILPEKVNNPDGHRLRIFRMLVQCCAADARPYSVPVDFGKKAPEFKEMTWVKVVGKMSYKKEGDQTVPIIEATKVEETTAPDNAMIY